MPTAVKDARLIGVGGAFLAALCDRQYVGIELESTSSMHGGALQVLNVPDSATLSECSGAGAAASIDRLRLLFQSWDRSAVRMTLWPF